MLAADFFDVQPDPTYDAVVGNPPYIRYQDFGGDARRKAQERALAQGVRLSGLASSWAAFTVHASSFLASDGRLGLVVPGELVSRDYASSIRAFLLRRFARVALVMFEARVFPDVLEEVILLLAEGSGGTDHFELYNVRDLADLPSHDFTASPERRWAPISGTARLTRVLGDDRGALVLESLHAEGVLAELSTYGDPRLGIVSGANKYFAVTPSGAHRHDFADDEVLRLSPPGSKHVRRVAFTEELWREQSDADARCLLFRPPAHSVEPSAGARRYIRAGGLDAPWVRRLLPVAAVSSATLASAELVGRAFGGGMLQVLPREAARMLVPGLGLLTCKASRLERAATDVDDFLALGLVDDASDLIDAIVLDGLDSRDLGAIRRARREFRSRRMSRASG